MSDLSFGGRLGPVTQESAQGGKQLECALAVLGAPGTNLHVDGTVPTRVLDPPALC